MTYPRITLITPSYNQGHFLEQTIRSVIDQGYPNLEYFVIDGGSTDESIEVLKKYTSGISYWVSEPDRGQTHAINKGLQKATGEIIGWVNSDDYLEKDSLFKIATQFRDPDFNCVIGKISYFNEQGVLWQSTDVVKRPAEKTLGSGVVPQPAMYFRKACYDRIGLLNEQLHFCFDSEWYMRYLIHYGISQIKEIPDILVHFRFHHNSKTMSNSLKFREERNAICYSLAMQEGLNPLASFLLQLHDTDLSYHFTIPEKKEGLSIARAMNYFLLLLGDEYYVQNEKQKAASCFLMIDERLFDERNRKYYRKLRFRNKWVPARVLDFFRKK